MSRSRLPALVAIPVLAASLLLGAAPASAKGTLDQSQTDTSGHVAWLNDVVVRPGGQTFTAGVTGRLVTVRLYPYEDEAGSTVQIRTVSGGRPTATVLASATLASSASLTWVSIPFAAPATVTAGVRYAIVVLAPSVMDFGTSGDPAAYGPGEFVLVLPDGVTWDALPGDLAFQTFVDTSYGFAWASPTKGKGDGVNTPRAGQVVEVAFSLLDRVRVSKLLAPGWPKQRRVDCSTGRPKAGTEWMTRPLGANGLTRDVLDYTYAWHVRPEWGDGPLACRELRIKLRDGTTHSALFRFQPAR